MQIIRKSKQNALLKTRKLLKPNNMVLDHYSLFLDLGASLSARAKCFCWNSGCIIFITCAKYITPFYITFSPYNIKIGGTLRSTFHFVNLVDQLLPCFLSNGY